MYHVRLEICAWFMRLREFWAVWLGLKVADDRTECMSWTPWGHGRSVALTQMSYWKRNWAHKGHAPERRASAARSLLQSNRGAFFWYPATTRWFDGFPRLPWSQCGRRPVWRGLNTWTSLISTMVNNDVNVYEVIVSYTTCPSMLIGQHDN